MLLNPYETTLGKTLNIKSLSDSLIDYLVSLDTMNLSYEYLSEPKSYMVFITGKNDTEKEFAPWIHPIIAKDHKDRDVLFIDLRTVVRPRDGFGELREIITNRDMFDFIVMKAIFTMKMNESTNVLIPFRKNLVLAYVTWISSSLKIGLNLTLYEQGMLDIAVGQYILTGVRGVDNETIDIDDMAFMLTSTIPTLRNMTRRVREVLEKLNPNPQNPLDLVDNIVKAVNNRMVGNLDTHLLYSFVSKTWGSINSEENIIMSFEHIPTIIAIIYSGAKHRSYSKSKLNTMLMNKKKPIDLDEMIKKIDMVMSDVAIY